MTNGQAGRAHSHWLTRRPTTPLDGAYRNALLLAHWSVRRKLNHVSSVQFSSVQLRRFVLASHLIRP